MDTIVARRAVIRDAAQLGWVLSELRAVNGSTQQRTADAVGMDRTQIAHLEAGRSGRYLTNLLEVLDHLGGSFVIEWNLPHPSAQTDELIPDGVADTSTLPVAGGRDRSLKVQSVDSIALTPAVSEAVRRSIEPALAQAEAMRRALAPMLAQMEEMGRALSMATQEEPDEEAP